MSRFAIGFCCITLLVSSSGCDTLGIDSTADALAISSGTSFGMCAGYCVTEMTLDAGEITFTERSWRTELPDRMRVDTLGADAWEHLQSLIDTTAFRRLEGVHGCPDCADGGAEWIQIETDPPVRVTFEFGHDLEGIEALQAEIREIRERFPR